MANDLTNLVIYCIGFVRSRKTRMLVNNTTLPCLCLCLLKLSYQPLLKSKNDMATLYVSLLLPYLIN